MLRPGAAREADPSSSKLSPAGAMKSRPASAVGNRISGAYRGHVGAYRPRRLRRTEIGVHADETGDADEQWPRRGRHANVDMGRRLELGDAANQTEVLRRDGLVHEHR